MLELAAAGDAQSISLAAAMHLVAVPKDLIETRAIDAIDSVVVETHEVQMPELRERTNQLRDRVRREALDTKICLDWI